MADRGVLLVTGGSRGIGAAVCRLGAKAGYAVVVNYAALPDRVRDLTPGLPMRRPGTAEEVARAVLWLASDEASYSTGAILDVSGARSILP